MQVAEALSNCSLRHPSRSLESPVPSPGANPFRLEILASDINYSFCARQEGSYADHQCSVDYGCRLRYFDKVGDRYVVKKNVKELVHFDFHNLKTEYLRNATTSSSAAT